MLINIAITLGVVNFIMFVYIVGKLHTRVNNLTFDSEQHYKSIEQCLFALEKVKELLQDIVQIGKGELK